MTTCESCLHEKATRTSVTGRRLCQRCDERTSALAAGLIAGGAQPGSALATEGWFQRLRAQRKK